MFAVMHNPKAAYNKAGIETRIDTADPHKLVLMLFEGAMLAVASASLHMQRHDGADDTARKGEAVSKAINIITNGLKASLDQEAGGELGGKLGALYDYMCARLLHANLNNQPAVLDEVSHLLAELKGAWEQIGNKP
ncbi:MAG: flagellar export chaperone FliS [Rhodocyclaceae bacterium]|nr:flagellar export chaperone FliS [Rhodocyclaceae bacterium]